MPAPKFKPTKTTVPVKSRVEERWLLEGAVVLTVVYRMPVVWTAYEPFKLKLGNAWYRIDFGHQLADGRLVLVETKESSYQANLRDSLTRVRVASGLFYFFEFRVAIPRPKKDGGGWTLDDLQGNSIAIQDLDSLGE